MKMIIEFRDFEAERDRQRARFYVIAVCAVTFILLLVLFVRANAEELKASWYSVGSLQKEGTWKYSKGVMANGQTFNEEAFTCATRLYELGEVLEIENKKNGKKVICRVTDRIGKRFGQSRIDLSKRAFMEIADCKQGIVPIRVRKVE